MCKVTYIFYKKTYVMCSFQQQLTFGVGSAVLGGGVGLTVLGGGVGAGPLSNPYSITPFHTRGENMFPNSPPAPLPS